MKAAGVGAVGATVTTVGNEVSAGILQTVPFATIPLSYGEYMTVTAWILTIIATGLGIWKHFRP